MKIILINLFSISFFVLSIFTFNLNAEDKESSISSIWNKIAKEGDDIIKSSFKSFSKILDQFQENVDQEIEEISKIIDGETELDMKDKIDSIRLYVEEVGQLKKKEIKASNFTIISKSKKDYRIAIDKVLEDIEPILFDGQVVNYSERIRLTKDKIKDFENKKVELNEKLLFAPEDSSLFTASKEEIKNEIERLGLLIIKSEQLIEKLEFDLKRKMYALGLNLSREQIRIMTTRIDGDDLAKSFAIFDVTRQITKSLGILMNKNSFSGSATTNYYGVYVILSEILSFSQRTYISRIEDMYMPALEKIEKNIFESIDFAKTSLKDTEDTENQSILQSNIDANNFSLEVLKQYKKILLNQKKSLENAAKKTREQTSVAYSTYDTAVNSANLVNLISKTQESFNKIMDMQLPEIIPFENSELEKKFSEISEQIINLNS